MDFCSTPLPLYSYCTDHRKDISSYFDIIESGTEWKLLWELPGVSKNLINIKIENNCLNISTEKICIELPKEYKCTYRGIEYGKVTKILTLPNNVDYKTVDANYIDGILQVVFKKIQENIINVEVK